ncbi:SapC family protein [Thiomicrospira sp. ALE5]|uniref:SapC family protein n=1 Tax=Thiomicrospira sp. ALE5 TaxID=748650 RepID=UPI0008E81818|nr:SapC family protein [Thiomicrospira sp. ALE5]SFR60732.1 SapC protein [Thiomicrospira sp. ALE5]
MFRNLTALNSEVHQNFCLQPSQSFHFAADTHLIKVMLPEFVQVSPQAPILFIEQSNDEGFIPVMLMGLNHGENIFVNNHGDWIGGYIPALIRRYPFSLVKSGDDNKLVVCFDESSGRLSATSQDEGAQALFIDGQPSDTLISVQNFLGEINIIESNTDSFVADLVAKNLLKPIDINYNESESNKTIRGAFVINEERLNNLPNETFIDFKNKGYLVAIYAHLISLQAVSKLINKKET